MKKITNSVKSTAVKLKNSFIAFNRRAICGNAGEGYIRCAGRTGAGRSLCHPERHRHAHRHPEDHGNVQL